MKLLNWPLIAAILALTTMTIIPFNAVATGYKNCADVAENIEKIHQKMRLGYTAKQGERLKTRLRQLKKQRVKCERYLEKNHRKLTNKKPKKQRNLTLNSTLKRPAKPNLYQYDNQGKRQTNWSYTASDARKAYWEKQQAIENKRIKALNAKYKNAIKDADNKQNDN